jgi:ATPase subunit of ABC transporter with duplicated ATPase domains
MENFCLRVDLNMAKGDKIVLFSKDSCDNCIYEILNANQTADSGTFDWGVTTNQAYLPGDDNHSFSKVIILVDWLRQWVKQKKSVMR